MKNSFLRISQMYYLSAITLLLALFSYGAFYYYKAGVLDTEFVSYLYDGTNRVKILKDRNDIDNIKKYAISDRHVEAQEILEKLNLEIKDLRTIKEIDNREEFNNNLSSLKESLNELQSSSELTNILSTLLQKVSSFEGFVSERNWPTLTRMSSSLRIKLSAARLSSNGVYSFDKINQLHNSINNDLESINNFTEGSGLPFDIKEAIKNRLKIVKVESVNLTKYIENKEKLIKHLNLFSANYQNWFKALEPEIALRKIQFEKSAQSVSFSIIAFISLATLLLAAGFFLNGFIEKASFQKSESNIITVLKEEIVPTQSKKMTKFSKESENEIIKLHDYIHRRMSFGSIFEEAMPFSSILLDSNLNLVWANDLFYKEWALENFKEDKESLSWDFLQRFTNLESHSGLLNSLRLNTQGEYDVEVKTSSMEESKVFKMYVSPVEYSNQKRVMIIFYPLLETKKAIVKNSNEFAHEFSNVLDSIHLHNFDVSKKNIFKDFCEKNGVFALYQKTIEVYANLEFDFDKRNQLIEKLESSISNYRLLLNDIKRYGQDIYDLENDSALEYQNLKAKVAYIIDVKDQMEEQCKYVLSSSKEIFKDQNKLYQHSERSERLVDEYTKSVTQLSEIKQDFKELKKEIEEYRLRMIQSIDQLLVVRSSESDSEKLEQYLQKIKFEMKGFDKSLVNFQEVTTLMDVSLSKLDLMISSREMTDLTYLKNKIETLKNNLDNAHFSFSKITQHQQQNEDELIETLRKLITNLKLEMKASSELSKLTGGMPIENGNSFSDLTV